MFTAKKYFPLHLHTDGCTKKNFFYQVLAFLLLLISSLLSPTLQGIFISTCNVDVRWFPFDIQRCELKFGSWTFDGWLLDIQMKEADVSGYMPNGEWDLVGETGCQCPA